MKKAFENLESVEAMMDFLSANKSDASDLESETEAFELPQELQVLNVQSFLKMYGKLKSLSHDEQSEFGLCAEAYNDSNNNPFTRQTALAYVCSLFFPQDEIIEKAIKRKNDSKKYETPCEDCTSKPTHLISFERNNRIEEHFLCEACEEAARAEDGDEGDE